MAFDGIGNVLRSVLGVDLGAGDPVAVRAGGAPWLSFDEQHITISAWWRPENLPGKMTFWRWHTKILGNRELEWLRVSIETGNLATIADAWSRAHGPIRTASSPGPEGVISAQSLLDLAHLLTGIGQWSDTRLKELDLQIAGIQEDDASFRGSAMQAWQWRVRNTESKVSDLPVRLRTLAEPMVTTAGHITEFVDTLSANLTDLFVNKDGGVWSDPRRAVTFMFDRASLTSDGVELNSGHDLGSWLGRTGRPGAELILSFPDLGTSLNVFSGPAAWADLSTRMREHWARQVDQIFAPTILTANTLEVGLLGLGSSTTLAPTPPDLPLGPQNKDNYDTGNPNDPSNDDGGTNGNGGPNGDGGPNDDSEDGSSGPNDTGSGGSFGGGPGGNRTLFNLGGGPGSNGGPGGDGSSGDGSSGRLGPGSLGSGSIDPGVTGGDGLGGGIRLFTTGSGTPSDLGGGNRLFTTGSGTPSGLGPLTNQPPVAGGDMFGGLGTPGGGPSRLSLTGLGSSGLGRSRETGVGAVNPLSLGGTLGSLSPSQLEELRTLGQLGTALTDEMRDALAGAGMPVVSGATDLGDLSSMQLQKLRSMGLLDGIPLSSNQESALSAAGLSSRLDPPSVGGLGSLQPVSLSGISEPMKHVFSSSSGRSGAGISTGGLLRDPIPAGGGQGGALGPMAPSMPFAPGRGAPRTGSQRDRRRDSWLPEEVEVWDAERAPGVLGRRPDAVPAQVKREPFGPLPEEIGVPAALRGEPSTRKPGADRRTSPRRRPSKPRD